MGVSEFRGFSVEVVKIASGRCFGFRFSDFGFRVSGFRFRSCYWFRVACFGLRSFGFRNLLFHRELAIPGEVHLYRSIRNLCTTESVCVRERESERERGREGKSARARERERERERKKELLH